jgi:hypothetical protein
MSVRDDTDGSLLLAVTTAARAVVFLSVPWSCPARAARVTFESAAGLLAAECPALGIECFDAGRRGRLVPSVAGWPRPAAPGQRSSTGGWQHNLVGAWSGGVTRAWRVHPPSPRRCRSQSLAVGKLAVWGAVWDRRDWKKSPKRTRIHGPFSGRMSLRW